MTPPDAQRGRAAPARTRKTAGLVAERIVADIIEADDPPGTMLPPEKEMIERYDVGRGALREALRFLEMQGILRVKTGPGGGPRITTPDSRFLAGNLALFLAIERTPFRAILDVRHTLEPPLAGKAALAKDPENLAEIEQSVDAFEALAGDHSRALAEN